MTLWFLSKNEWEFGEQNIMKKHRIRKMQRSPKNFTPNINPSYPIPNEEEKIKFNFF